MVKPSTGQPVATSIVARPPARPFRSAVTAGPPAVATKTPPPPPAVRTVRAAASKIKAKVPPYSIASRWTDKLAGEGFTPISIVFLDSYALLDITNNEAMFIVHLMRFKWNDKMPFPGLNKIAEKMNVSHISVRKYARDLETKGFLIRKMRKGLTTRYDLTPLFKALEQKLAEVKKTNAESKKEEGE